MLPKYLCPLILAVILPQATASLILGDFSTQTVDFTGFVGNGFAPTPGAGQLDSDTWRATGLSDGNGVFGGTHTTDDFARGTDSPHNGVSTGGVYGFEISSGDNALGVQPTGADFTPGAFTLRLQNNTGQTLGGFDLGYDVLVYNDQNRSNSFNFSFSTDDASYTQVPALDFISPAARTPANAGGPTWATAPRSTTLTGLSVADGSFFYLQWTGNNVGGSGSRDEFALDNITITAIPEPSSTLALGLLLGLSVLRTRRRR